MIEALASGQWSVPHKKMTAEVWLALAVPAWQANVNQSHFDSLNFGPIAPTVTQQALQNGSNIIVASPAR